MLLRAEKLQGTTAVGLTAGRHSTAHYSQNVEKRFRLETSVWQVLEVHVQKGAPDGHKARWQRVQVFRGQGVVALCECVNVSLCVWRMLASDVERTSNFI